MGISTRVRRQSARLHNEFIQSGGVIFQRRFTFSTDTLDSAGGRADVQERTPEPPVQLREASAERREKVHKRRFVQRQF